MGLVVKKRKWTAKKRNLILTDAPRMVYVDPKKMVEKGEIPFSDQLWVELRSDRNFIIHVPKRNYVLEDINCDAKKWADVLTPLVIQFRDKQHPASGSSAGSS
eukprot:EC692172.1.p3 GENE.EC692172.1~~EC692172.1.p3  ORF type:complete len:103 (+),score=39.70 EC692172.1:180-488(+)